MIKNLHLHYAIGILLGFAAFLPLAASELEQTLGSAEMNTIATNAFAVLKAIPSTGLERSVGGVEQIIDTHKRLSRETGSSQRHLSLVLADAVAYAIITEMHRAELTRIGRDDEMTPRSVGFEKKTAIRLWKANMPEFAPLIRKALQSKDVVTGYVAERSSEDDVLNGSMIQNMPPGQMRTHISDLHDKATIPLGVRRNPLPDEQLVYALTKAQAFQDLAVIMDLYEDGDLPWESSLLRSAIDGVLKRYHERRLDDGMKMSSFKVWATFTAYYPENTSRDAVGPADEYCLRQAFVLAPFMTNTSILPELAQKALAKMDRSVASPPSK